jgi:hypothetical protein
MALWPHDGEEPSHLRIGRTRQHRFSIIHSTRRSCKTTSIRDSRRPHIPTLNHSHT